MRNKENKLMEDETLLEFFIRLTSIESSVENIIQVLAYMNPIVFNQAEGKRKEIIEFGNYFISNGYEERTRTGRVKHFGEDDAYILSLYYKIYEEEDRKKIQEVIRDINHEQYMEAISLTDKIFEIKENLEVTLSTLDGPISFFYAKEELEHNEIGRQEFFDYMAYAIMLGTAGIIVRIKAEPKDILYGIRIYQGKWKPLKVYELMENDRELDMTVIYTEIARN